ncbi:MAG: MATE family efflux transporter [Alphaproteobacteria bacterium]
MEQLHYAGAELTPWSWAWIRVRAWRHMLDMLRLSPPIIASRLAGFFLVVVDTMMVLRYSASHNQWLSAGVSASNIFLGASIGFTVGVPVLVSRFYGAKKYDQIGNTWRHGLIWSIITGGIFSIACILLAKPILHIGDSDIIKHAYPIAVVYSLSFIPNMIWMVGSGVLEGTERPVPVFVLSIFGNVLNILLNWFFVYGVLFFPEWGAIGSAFASLSVRVFMAIITTLYVLNINVAKKFNLRSLYVEPFKKWKELRAQGNAAAIAIFFEMGGWSLFGLYAVRKPLTMVDTAAWTINMQILATIFMIALGLGAATGVRVGVARGRKDFDDQIFAILVGVGITVFALIIAGLLAFIFAENLASIFNTDPTIIMFSASLTIYLLWVFIPDGIQVVLAQSLRTSGITWITTFIAAASYGTILPISGYILAFEMGRGIKGMFEALIIGCWIISISYFILLFFRFKDIKKMTLEGDDEPIDIKG